MQKEEKVKIYKVPIMARQIQLKFGTRVALPS